MNRYSEIKKILNTNPNVGKLDTPYYKNALYPEIPPNPNDIYVITEWGDRLDLLANQFYGDASKWWIIATANALGKGTLFTPEDIILRIPPAADIQKFIDSENKQR